MPDLAATQRTAGAAVTQRAARRAERVALGPIYDDRSLAALLRSHGIGPIKIRTEDGPRQGYRADQFREMWSRYNLNGHHAEGESGAVEA